MKNLIKKIAKSTAMACLLFTVLTGCGGNSNTTTTTSPSNNSSSSSDNSSSNQAQTTSSNKDTIRLPLGSEIDSLDPRNSAAGDTAAIMMNVFEGLMGFDEHGNFIPALAESYEVLNDGLSYQFNLKQDVKFHNGEDFTASDVISTYNQLAGFDGYEGTSSTIKNILESIEFVDDYTVIMNLFNVDSGFLSKCIELITKEGYLDDATSPNGTGPYKFVNYVHGEKITFTINEDYSTTDKIPSVKNIEVSIMTDSNAILLALKSGELDIATILANDIPLLENDYNIYEFPQNMVQYFALNNTVAGLDNPDVRKALNLAIDKDEVIDLSTFGAGTQVETFLSPVLSVSYNFDIPQHQQDIDTAIQLLADSGYEDFSFTVTVPSNYQTHVDTAQVIKNQLSKIGVNMEIELVEWATWLDQVYYNEDYEATICAQVGKLDPQDFLNRFTSSYGRNFYNFSNAEYDELISLGATSTDNNDVISYYKQAQQILVDETAAVFIQDPSLLYATTTDIDGIVNFPYRFIDFSSFKFIG